MANKQDSETNVLSSFFIARGIAGVLFGIITLAWPGLTIATLGLFIMLWLVINGITLIIQSFMTLEKGLSAIGGLLLGLFQIGVGAYLVQRPGVTVTTVVTLIALNLVIEGVLAIANTFMNKSHSSTANTVNVMTGILYLVAGISIWRYPVSGTLAFVWLLGVSALVGGALQIAIASDIKRLSA